MPKPWVLLLGTTVFAFLVVPPVVAGETDAAAMLDALKGLEGSWRGPAIGTGTDALPEGEEPPLAIHEFRVSAAGTVVMETMNPGTEHEMINMYHLDNGELMLTHYCSSGNQPLLRLVADKSSTETMVFDLAGGSNLDPAVDEHIHSAEITLKDDDHLVSSWMGYKDGEAVGTMTFELERTD